MEASACRGLAAIRESRAGRRRLQLYSSTRRQSDLIACVSADRPAIIACARSCRNLAPPLSDNEYWDILVVFSKYYLPIARQKSGRAMVNFRERLLSARVFGFSNYLNFNFSPILALLAYCALFASSFRITLRRSTCSSTRCQSTKRRAQCVISRFRPPPYVQRRRANS